MKNNEFVQILEHIQGLIDKEEYQKINDYIDIKKTEIISEEDIASEYIDELVKSLV